MDRATLIRNFNEFIQSCELSVNNDVIEILLERKLQPLLDRIEELEMKLNRPTPRWLGEGPNLHQVRIEGLDDRGRSAGLQRPQECGFLRARKSL